MPPKTTIMLLELRHRFGLLVQFSLVGKACELCPQNDAKIFNSEHFSHQATLTLTVKFPKICFQSLFLRIAWTVKHEIFSRSMNFVVFIHLVNNVEFNINLKKQLILQKKYSANITLTKSHGILVSASKMLHRNLLLAEKFI